MSKIEIRNLGSDILYIGIDDSDFYVPPTITMPLEKLRIGDADLERLEIKGLVIVSWLGEKPELLFSNPVFFHQLM